MTHLGGPRGHEYDDERKKEEKKEYFNIVELILKKN